MSIVEKRQAFQELHQSGCFVLPNPWDVGTARYLEHAGFKALATTSAGFAFARGQLDGVASLEETLAHAAELVRATKLPVNVDFEDGFGAGVAENVRRCADLGAAGISLEDNAGGQLYAFEEAVARVAAASQALEGTGVVLVARSEGLLIGKADLAETVRRLQAFSAAGADCLYAPGLKTLAEVQAVVEACAPKPVNVLVSAPGFTVAQLASLGVRRISVGGALARTAWGAMMRAIREILEKGTFDEFAGAARMADFQEFLAQDDTALAP
ncbi:isocitrate lyase/phosphoenolpyruvate mutase family protein [bacterium]|nr:isocitrate lyase/phosphoenolpyruvate mutase family protein [bacterium]